MTYTGSPALLKAASPPKRAAIRATRRALPLRLLTEAVVVCLWDRMISEDPVLSPYWLARNLDAELGDKLAKSRMPVLRQQEQTVEDDVVTVVTLP